jgi:ABC-type amino acid transport substrate-binding protein
MLIRRLLHCILIVGSLAAAQLASAACIPVRFGYPDQNRPPYYMGDGPTVPEPAGATVDLMRDAIVAAGFGCPPQLVRLPPARLRLALSMGDIDFMAMGEMATYPPEIAIPRDRNGAIDFKRAMSNELVVLVRAGTTMPDGVTPLAWFKDKTLGTPQGSSMARQLRDQGLTVDDGARDIERNIEKLKLGRVDGVVVSTVKAGHVEAILKRYHGEIAQLSQPLIVTRLWLAFNRTYYLAHKDHVEALWTWIDANRGRLGYVMQKYSKD